MFKRFGSFALFGMFGMFGSSRLGGASGEGWYRLTLLAILVIDSADRGGLHRASFSARRAASMAGAVIPRRRIVPARLASVALRWPSGMGASLSWTGFPLGCWLISHNGAGAMGSGEAIS